MKRIIFAITSVVIFLILNLISEKLLSNTVYLYPVFGKTVLSKGEIDLIKKIKTPVEIIAFIEKDNILKKGLEQNLNMISGYNSFISTRIIRVDINPELAVDYGIYRINSILIKTEGRQVLIDSFHLKEIINGIRKCTSGDYPAIFAASGHNEPSLKKERIQFLQFFERNGYIFHQDILSEKIFEYKIIIFPGIGNDITMDELELLNNYVQKGGKIVFLLEQPDITGLEIETYYQKLLSFLKQFNLSIKPFPKMTEYEISVLVNRSNLLPTEINSFLMINPLITDEDRYIMRSVSTTKLLICPDKKSGDKFPVGIYSKKEINKSENSQVVLIGDGEFTKDKIQNINGWYYLLDIIRFLDHNFETTPETPEIKGIINNISAAKKFYLLVVILPLFILSISIKRKRSFIP
ncbi:MAG: Gldg family protein [bacterium]|nr:Gldg family protein [bacterium]